MKAGGKRPGSGQPKKEKVLITKCFIVDEEAYNKADALYPKQLSKKVNAYIKRLANTKPAKN